MAEYRAHGAHARKGMGMPNHLKKGAVGGTIVEGAASYLGEVEQLHRDRRAAQSRGTQCLQGGLAGARSL